MQLQLPLVPYENGLVSESRPTLLQKPMHQLDSSMMDKKLAFLVQDGSLKDGKIHNMPQMNLILQNSHTPFLVVLIIQSAGL